MGNTKSLFKNFLCLMFFVVLFMAIVLVTNVVFNKTSTFFDRYENFNIETNYEVQK